MVNTFYKKKRNDADALAAKKIGRARKVLRASDGRQARRTKPTTYSGDQDQDLHGTVADTRHRRLTSRYSVTAKRGSRFITNKQMKNVSTMMATERGDARTDDRTLSLDDMEDQLPVSKKVSGRAATSKSNIVNGTRALKKGRRTPARVDALPSMTEESEQIRELQRQLNEEKEKNRILGSEKAKQSTVKLIPRPKGRYNLMMAMMLNPEKKSDKMLYNDIRASVRQLIFEGRLDFGLTTKHQSLTKMGNIARAAREVEPYLARFENDWVTDVIIRQYINGKRKTETAKDKSGLKRKNASASQSVERWEADAMDNMDQDDNINDDVNNDNDEDNRSNHDANGDDSISSSEWERLYGDRTEEDDESDA